MSFSRRLLALTSMYLLCGLSHSQSVYNLNVGLSDFEFATDRKFLSIAVSSRTIYRTEGRNPQFNIDSPRFATLTKALAPSAVRVGGSYANFLVFSPDGSKSQVVPKRVMAEWQETFDTEFLGGQVGKKNWGNVLIQGRQWSRLANYVEAVGWDMVFDVNQLLQRNGRWDETNFRLFLDYSKDNNITISGFQLGNEPNSYRHKFGYSKTVKSMVADYIKFKQVLQDYPEYKDAMIIGPEPTSLARSKKAREFMDDFLEKGGGDALDAIGLHHYYFDGDSATEEDFLNPDTMDTFKSLTSTCATLRDKYSTDIPIYMTETANAYGGGAPTLSQSFVSTFLWMDELGLAAKYGLNRVFRQTLNSGNYGLIDSDTLTPYPDYYFSLLYKRLIEGPVLDVTFEPSNKQIRLYAHCTRKDSYNLRSNSIVLIYANLQQDTLTLDLSRQYGTRTVKLFILTSGELGQLSSQEVRLNGQKLTMLGDQLPEMSPVTHTGPITVPGHSLGFIVVPRGRAKVCKYFHNDEPSSIKG